MLTVLGLGIFGMNRSLWLDEAWVANSVQAPSLSGMFRYSGWLQVNPPLFLLLVRGVVRLAGASNTAFRLIPLLLACAAAAGALAVSWRLLPAPLAVLASAIVVLDPTAIEYSRMLKPYSGELAASAVLLLLTVRYLEQPNRSRFVWLLAGVAVCIPLAYATVFLLSGIVLAVAATGVRRGVWMTVLAGSELLALLWFSIRPNLAPELHAYWAADVDHGMNAGLLAALGFCIFSGARVVRNFARGDRSPRTWAYIVCVLPCLLLAVSGGLGLYPVSHRTRLFAMPCFVLLAMLTVDDLLKKDLLRRFADRKLIHVMATALTIGLVGFAVASQIVSGFGTAEEDFAGAVSFLEKHAAAPDLILVHACCKEGFLLYSAMDGWNPPRVVFGNTGWPCCARGKDARPGASSERATIADLDAKIPRGYSGRVWLLYTTRPTHWSYTGLDEGNLWRNHLWDRGCPPGPYLRFANLAISPMNCVAAR
jgi:hypothetical protein